MGFVVDNVALGEVPVQHLSSPSQYHSTNAPFAFIHLPPTPHRVVNKLFSLQAWNFPWFSSIPPQEWWVAALIRPGLHFPATYQSITSTSDSVICLSLRRVTVTVELRLNTTKTDRCLQKYSSIRPAKLRDNNLIKPKPLLFRRLPIHRSPIILPSIFRWFIPVVRAYKYIGKWVCTSNTTLFIEVY